jgi:outer membrane protein assembly factor BamB
MGSRSTPVISDNQLYLISGAGEVICYELEKRKRKWTLPFINSYHDTIPKFGYAESVLIYGDRLYCTPGGQDYNILCLDKNNGEILWSSPGNGDKPTYSSAIMINHEDNKILVVVLENSIIALDSENGNLFWEIAYNAAYGSHANTPVYYDGWLYMCSSAKDDKGGFIGIELSNDLKEAAILWKRMDIANYLSGFVVREGKIYTNSGRKKKWFCLDAKTGETIYTWEDYKAGIPLFADGLFYIFCENGDVHLSRDDQNSFTSISNFMLDISTVNPFAPLWATPVIKNKKLFIRHKGSLIVYDLGIKE